jgi:hypothetical protein
MVKKLIVSDADFTALYSTGKLRVSALADMFGVSRQAIWYRAVSLGLKTYKRKSESCKCVNCGAVFETWPSQSRSGKYCSRRCYFEKTSLHGRYSRQGQRKAREVAGAVAGEVVHHIDGDALNNEHWNLVVFGSNAGHMSFHKGGRADALKSVLPQYGEPDWGGPFREAWALGMTGPII